MQRRNEAAGEALEAHKSLAQMVGRAWEKANAEERQAADAVAAAASLHQMVLSVDGAGGPGDDQLRDGLVTTRTRLGHRAAAAKDARCKVGELEDCMEQIRVIMEKCMKDSRPDIDFKSLHIKAGE